VACESENTGNCQHPATGFRRYHRLLDAIPANTAVILVPGEQQVGGGSGVRRYKVRRNHRSRGVPAKGVGDFGGDEVRAELQQPAARMIAGEVGSRNA
jgi:hypothetical protein